ncbi:MAG TPA: hypothetical protein DEA47_00280 [Peptococcaceae bacterium]|nr:MAG: Uncharacterized protein XD50_0364 [Clostridia bacterium 41_269]HBT19812.1 hypothetical protein [Peptococcaceae bacterium]
MDRIVAVDEDLSSLKEALEEHGYSVVGLGEGDIKKAHAVVVSGMDQNIMLMEDIKTKVPVFSAEGKTQREIIEDLEEYFENLH